MLSELPGVSLDYDEFRSNVLNKPDPLPKASPDLLVESEPCIVCEPGVKRLRRSARVSKPVELVL